MAIPPNPQRSKDQQRDAAVDLDSAALNELEQVKALLLGAERVSIDGLGGRLDELEALVAEDPEFADRIAKRLALGLKQLDAKNKRAVTIQLLGLLREDIKHEVSKAEPQILQALAPNFSALIRKGIQSEFEKLILYINDRISGTSSPVKRLQIRVKSLLSGRPEAELWLEAFPQYSLSSVLLVHRPSGMLVKSLRRERSSETGAVVPGGQVLGSGEGNEEIVAGMLSAIANFAKDAFNDTNAGALKTLDFDTGYLVIMSAPLVRLAVLVEGPAPADLEDRIGRVFDAMMVDHHELIVGYDGSLNDEQDASLQEHLHEVLTLSYDPSTGEDADGQAAKVGPGSKPPGNTQASSKHAQWYRRPWAILAYFPILALMIWLMWSSFQSLQRDNLLDKAQQAVFENAMLQPYPLNFTMEPGSNVMQVYGLISGPQQLQELNQTLAEALPNTNIVSNVRTVWDETVAPQIETLNVKVETNSISIGLLDEEVNIQKLRIRDVESMLDEALQISSLARVVEPSAPYFYASQPLIDLRDQIDSFLSERGAVATIGFEDLSLEEVERLVAGLTIAFNDQGEMKDADKAFRVGEVLGQLLSGHGAGRQVNMVAVVHSQALPKKDANVSSVEAGEAMLRQAQRVLVSNGIHRRDLKLKIIVRPSADGAANPTTLDQAGENWRKNSFVGFSFAD